MELGSTGWQRGWTKTIVDAMHDLSWYVTDHRALDLQSRVTFGILNAPGVLPAGTGFFGGAREQLFVSTDVWHMRANPQIRSVPANGFNLNGASGDRFVAYNLTASYPFWTNPLVPATLIRDPEFNGLLQGQIVSATSVLQMVEQERDAHFKNVLTTLGRVQPLLV